MRFRHVYMIGFTFLTFLMLFVTSPDVGIIDSLPMGAGFIATVVLMLRAVIYVAILHFSRKALFDYLDMEALHEKAKTDPMAAAVAMVAMAIAMIAIAMLIVAAVG
jgi:hypothetical protein